MNDKELRELRSTLNPDMRLSWMNGYLQAKNDAQDAITAVMSNSVLGDPVWSWLHETPKAIENRCFGPVSDDGNGKVAETENNGLEGQSDEE